MKTEPSSTKFRNYTCETNSLFNRKLKLFTTSRLHTLQPSLYPCGGVAPNAVHKIHASYIVASCPARRRCRKSRDRTGGILVCPASVLWRSSSWMSERFRRQQVMPCVLVKSTPFLACASCRRECVTSFRAPPQIAAPPLRFLLE